MVNTLGAVGDAAKAYFETLGQSASELTSLVSLLGVYGSAEKILLTHAPAKARAQAAA